MKLKVNEVFRNLMPPLSFSEFAELENSCIQQGIREPIEVWKGKNTIIDGDNRYQIAVKHDLPFTTRELAFPDEDAVMVWIISKQMGRRNLTPYNKCVLALRMEDLLKETYVAPPKSSVAVAAPSLPNIKAAFLSETEKVAKEVDPFEEVSNVFKTSVASPGFDATDPSGEKAAKKAEREKKKEERERRKEERERKKVEKEKKGAEKSPIIPTTEKPPKVVKAIINRPIHMAAKFAGVSPNTYNRVKRLVESAEDSVLQELREGGLSINKAYTVWQTKKDDNDKVKDLEINRSKNTTTGVYDILYFDFSTFKAEWVSRTKKPLHPDDILSSPSGLFIGGKKLPISVDSVLLIKTDGLNLQKTINLSGILGFTYRNCINLESKRVERGWVNNVSEIFVLATKGQPLTPISVNRCVSNVKTVDGLSGIVSGRRFLTLTSGDTTFMQDFSPDMFNLF